MGGGPHPRSPTSQQLACLLRPHRLPPAPSPALLMRGIRRCQLTALWGSGWWVGWEQTPGFGGLVGQGRHG